MQTSATTGATSGQSAGRVPNKFELGTEDFINMMVTQLQNQDPLEPAKNEQLLAQMSQIGQLEASTQLQNSLKSMVLQNNLGASGNLIGKKVTGIGEFGGQTTEMSGVVTSVRVEGDNIWLELDTGHALRMDRVTQVAGEVSASSTE